MGSSGFWVIFDASNRIPDKLLGNRDQIMTSHVLVGCPGGSEGKVSACNTRDLGLILGLGRSPGEGSGNPLQCSCLENPMDRGAWLATVHGVAKCQTGLSDFTFFLSFLSFIY